MMPTTNYGWTTYTRADSSAVAAKLTGIVTEIDTTLAAKLGTNTAKTNDFVATTGWSTTTTGGVAYPSYWRVLNGWAECQIILRQSAGGGATFTVPSGSFNPGSSTAFRPPDERVVTWRGPNGQWGVGSISAGGNIWLNGISGQVIANQALIYIAMVPYSVGA